MSSLSDLNNQELNKKVQKRSSIEQEGPLHIFLVNSLDKIIRVNKFIVFDCI